MKKFTINLAEPVEVCYNMDALEYFEEKSGINISQIAQVGSRGSVWLLLAGMLQVNPGATHDAVKYQIDRYMSMGGGTWPKLMRQLVEALKFFNVFPQPDAPTSTSRPQPPADQG